MSNGHTPGPWIVDAPGMVATKATGADGWEICDIRTDVPECDANADLIAAAPALLAALEDTRAELLAMIDKHNKQDPDDGSWLYDYQTVVEADEAIAKARGTP